MCHRTMFGFLCLSYVSCCVTGAPEKAAEFPPVPVLIKEVMRRAESGNARDQGIMAGLYQSGLAGFWRSNLDTALFWAKKSAAEGHPFGRYILALLHVYPSGPLPQNEPLAKRLVSDVYPALSDLAKGGDSWAMICLTGVHASPFTGYEDHEKVRSYAMKAARAGNPVAQYNLSVLYAAKWYGFERDWEKVVKWAELAAEKGHPAAQKMLASYYEDGVGVEEDKAKALKYYRKALENYKLSRGREKIREAISRLEKDLSDSNEDL